MNKNFKPVYVRGTETGKGVIEALEALGGKNNCGYKGNCETNLYYIDPNTNFICGINVYAQFAPYVKATAEEIKPLRWRAEKNGSYYIINWAIGVKKLCDDREPSDDKLYNSGNYFRTREEAQEMAEKIKKVLLPD